jgi:hypothetical protein
MGYTCSQPVSSFALRLKIQNKDVNGTPRESIVSKIACEQERLKPLPECCHCECHVEDCTPAQRGQVSMCPVNVLKLSNLQQFL